MELAAGVPEGWLDREHAEVTGEEQRQQPPEGYIDPDELMVAVQEVWDAMEIRGEKISPSLLMSAAYIYLQLRNARGEASPDDASQSITIARSTIKSLDINR
ncbi:hypothetical protein [Microbulbifer sp. TYP-18]|uniref:hypothetical protein n=1 Tax=Microbulbifer sp. TYP-18 TaxID=3230024 RepID=UPI0034C6D403